MKKESSKKILLTLFVVIVGVVAILGFTYAIFKYLRTSSLSSSITAGKLEFGYIEDINGINLQNAMPISDEVAINTTDENNYFDFYVTYDVSENLEINYEIDIENTSNKIDMVSNGSIEELSTSCVKVALENRNEVAPLDPMLVNPTYFLELENNKASNSKNGYILYKNSITGKSKDYYRLYMWIAEVDIDGNEMSMSDEGEHSIGNKDFSVQINVQAIGKSNS